MLRHDEQRHEGEGKQRQAADGEDGPGQQQSEVIGMAGLLLMVVVVVLLQMVRLIKVLLVIDGDSLVSVEGHVFRGGEERRGGEGREELSMSVVVVVVVVVVVTVVDCVI